VALRPIGCDGAEEFVAEVDVDERADLDAANGRAGPFRLARQNGARQELEHELHERPRRRPTLDEHVGSVGTPWKDLELLRLSRPAVPLADSVGSAVWIVGRGDEELCFPAGLSVPGRRPRRRHRRSARPVRGS
jgi:hypothetical protein